MIISSINSVDLVGRTGQDVDMKYLDNGKCVAKVSIAVNRPTKNRETDWFALEFWNKTAEIAAAYVRKGSLIGITGSLKIDSWIDPNTGMSRSRPVIQVSQLTLLGSKKDEDENERYNDY